MSFIHMIRALMIPAESHMNVTKTRFIIIGWGFTIHVPNKVSSAR